MGLWWWSQMRPSARKLSARPLALLLPGLGLLQRTPQMTTLSDASTELLHSADGLATAFASLVPQDRVFLLLSLTSHLCVLHCAQEVISCIVLQ